MSASPSSESAPNTRTEHSAGGVVVRRVDRRVHVLLIRDPYGHWGLPKGHLEDGEDARDAAVREVREETGLERIEMGPEVETIDWYFRRDAVVVHKICTFYLMHSGEGEVEPEVDEGITECVWVPVEGAAERVGYANTREVVREARKMLDLPESPFDL